LFKQQKKLTLFLLGGFSLLAGLILIVTATVGGAPARAGDIPTPAEPSPMSQITTTMLGTGTIVVDQTNSSNTFTLKAGYIYKFEVWGAQGGHGNGNTLGGLGSYAIGWYDMREQSDQTITWFAGGQGNNGVSATMQGSSNTLTRANGGTSNTSTARYNGITGGLGAGGGGGASSGILIGTSELIVAGGGGGAGGRASGGSGGGTTGTSGGNSSYTNTGNGSTVTVNGGSAGTSTGHGSAGGIGATDGSDSQGGDGTLSTHQYSSTNFLYQYAGGGGGGAGGSVGNGTSASGGRKGYSGGGGRGAFQSGVVHYGAGGGGGSGGTSFIGGVTSISGSTATTTWAQREGHGWVVITEYVMAHTITLPPQSGEGWILL